MPYNNLFDFQDSHFTEQWWHMVQYVDMPKYGVCVYSEVIAFNNQGVTEKYWTYTLLNNMHNKYTQEEQSCNWRKVGKHNCYIYILCITRQSINIVI